MKLQFKFKDSVGPEARKKVAADLSAKGAKRVRPLFPNARDKVLASIYIFDIGDKQNGKQLKKILSTSRAIEFVEKEVRRKLV